jgi:hypothetical protein
MLGSDKEHERETARKKLISLLAEHGLTFNDIPEILLAVRADDNDAPPPPPPDPSDEDLPQVNVFHLVQHLVRQHIYVSPEESTAIALWILHAWIFRRFDTSPRLALLSPTRGCGKSTTMKLIEWLVPDPWKLDGISPATIYRQRPLPIFLLDEFDQANLRGNDVLKQVLHGGWEDGGSLGRFIKGAQKLSTYTPVAMAAIGGQSLSLPLFDRSIVIRMDKPPPNASISRLKKSDPVFKETKKQIARWARETYLNEDPDTSFQYRLADKWRALLSVADSLDAGEEARAAALKLEATRPDIDPGVALLYDIRIVFQQRGDDRITSVELVAALHELSDFWLDWDDDHPGRKLTQSHVARLLRAFHIKSKVIWPMHRGPGSKSKRGYTLDQFRDAWLKYCSDDDTASQRKKTIRLVGS